MLELFIEIFVVGNRFATWFLIFAMNYKSTEFDSTHTKDGNNVVQMICSKSLNMDCICVL